MVRRGTRFYSCPKNLLMAKLDLEWLILFNEIYKTGSVSRVAERHGLAQGTASIALNKLRSHFGDKLFSRTSRGMEPTR